MKCPKCGHDNPDLTLFCEECDWKMIQPFKGERAPTPPMYAAILAAILGIASVLLWQLEIAYGAIGCGGVGLVLGGYASRVGRMTTYSNRVPTIVISLVGVLLSAIGFIMGINIL